MDARKYEAEFVDGLPFISGSLWIDLLNTVMSSGEKRTDLIDEDERFVAWLALTDMLPDSGIVSAGSKSDVQKLREELRTAVDLFNVGIKPPVALTELINGLLADCNIKLALEWDEKGCRLIERFEPGNAGPSGKVAADFARFVCEAEPQRLRHCSNPACTMVFYDTSKNNTRRWCTMSICGNRDKVARFRARRAG